MSRRGGAAAALFVLLGGLLGGVLGAGGASATRAGCAEQGGALIVYDTTGEFGVLGARYATMTANLVSAFGRWDAVPAVEYEAGEIACHDGVVYIGSTYGEPLPSAFLDDVAAGTTPVLWLRENLWQLAGRLPVTEAPAPDTRPFDRVVYAGQELARDLPVDPGLAGETLGPDAVTLAEARTAEGESAPWATRAGSLTYVAEIPFLYMSGADRYLAFTDLLIDVLAPDTPERHRALVRLEDVSPATDPSLLRAAVAVLAEERVPFAIALIPEYRQGDGDVVELADRPELVAAVREAVAAGATLVLHGTTHQIDGLDNPYNGETAADYEYFRAELDAADNVVLTGPLEDDTVAAWTARMQRGLDAVTGAGLPRPWIITPPHYAASPAAYEAMRSLFAARFDRGLYFDGQLRSGEPDTGRFFDQFFTYPVTDEHGMLVVPENLGNIAPVEQNNNAPRTVDDLVANARANLVVREGFAAFFWHPYLVTAPGVGVETLRELVVRIRELGYTFVGLPDVVPGIEVFSGELDVWEPPDVRPYQVLAVGLAVWLPVRWVRRRPQPTDR